MKKTPNQIIAGMGAIPHESGVAFRVWAPNAKSVAVFGTFNDFDKLAHPMAPEDNGTWYINVPEAKPGDEYKFLLKSGENEFERIDPYARQVTSSVGNGVVIEADYDWDGDNFIMPPWNKLVIYEMHVGTFNNNPDPELPGDFRSIFDKFDHLKKLGVNALQIMPVWEFAGDFSWGYNPAHIFAIETAYGGPDGFRHFVKEAHRHGFAVILDVVYNHFGPSDLDLWQFDGWSENDGGGIYFYNDRRRETPWGDTRPDYGREEVYRFIRDNAVMWVQDYHVDGLRWDMTLYIRSIGADGGNEEDRIPEGITLMRRVNEEVRTIKPDAITIAEDLQDEAFITDWDNGAAFGSQWASAFVHTVRESLINPDDESRNMDMLAEAISIVDNEDCFKRVIYTESHDEVANGKARVVTEISADGTRDFYSQKRSTLGAGLVFTCPGIPMIFQGQEFLEGDWFRDTVPLDWNLSEDFHGIVRLYRDLIKLRLDQDGITRGLTGQGFRITKIDNENNIIVFHRFDETGPKDDVVIVCNFSVSGQESYRIGLPRAGWWKVRFHSDWKGYSDIFTDFLSYDTEAIEEELDGCGFAANVGIGPYSLLIMSQDE